METRDFGKRSGLKVAPVSIGAMRLPGESIDAVNLVRRAIDAGMRYIDTSRGYGESEWHVGRALEDGYRDRVALSTKCSPWIRKVVDTDEPNAETVRRRIEESMTRLGVDVLDFYQVWNVNKRENWEKAVAPGGMVDGIRQAMEDGLVRHTGFTTHDTVENVVEYCETQDWPEVILVSYNMLKTDYAPALAAAKANGIGTIVMNPVGGGQLAEQSPVLLQLAEQVGAVSVPDMAVRYVLSNPDVDTILCGMNKPSDVDDTVASAERDPFTRDQIARIDAFIADRQGENVGFCTGCNYCMPCPQGIKIPQVMSCIHQDRFLGLKEAAKRQYNAGWGVGKIKADACKQCGQCEPKCTQGLEIMKEMAYAAAQYGD
jgi:predicted aldo/keto reductase-like oxidoreductase